MALKLQRIAVLADHAHLIFWNAIRHNKLVLQGNLSLCSYQAGHVGNDFIRNLSRITAQKGGTNTHSAPIRHSLFANRNIILGIFTDRK